MSAGSDHTVVQRWALPLVVVLGALVVVFAIDQCGRLYETEAETHQPAPLRPSEPGRTGARRVTTSEPPVAVSPASAADVPEVQCIITTDASTVLVAQLGGEPVEVEVSAGAIVLPQTVSGQVFITSRQAVAVAEVHDGRCVPDPIILPSRPPVGQVLGADGHPVEAIVYCDMLRMESDADGGFEMALNAGGCDYVARTRSGPTVYSPPVFVEGMESVTLVLPVATVGDGTRRQWDSHSQACFLVDDDEAVALPDRDREQCLGIDRPR